jgi:hypothetical protein
LVWSLNALGEGVFPDRDHRGRKFGRDYEPHRAKFAGFPLAGGYVGCWAELRGDWKFLKQVLKLQEHYSNRVSVCHLCKASGKTPGLEFTDFSMTAPHRLTRHASTSWWNKYASCALFSPLLLIPGFCIWHCYFDIMHSLDLGVYQTTLASIMWVLTRPGSGVFRGRSRQSKFNSAYRAYKRWCKRLKVQSVVRHRFKKSQWKKDGWPGFSQRAANAASTRTLAYWIKDICRTRAHGATGRMMAAMMTYFVEADKISRRADRIFTNDEHSRYARCMENALLLNNALAVSANGRREKLFKLLPKHHALTHIAYDTLVNPRRTQCYQDEDMVGRGKRIYCACHGTSAPRNAVRRYAILICLRWWQELRSTV